MVLPPTDKYVDVPRQSEWNLDPNASYVHICANETIHGKFYVYLLLNSKNVMIYVKLIHF